MKRVWKWLRNVLKWAFFAIIVLPIADKHLFGQFPVLLVDTAVHNRLAEEWEPENHYQHERGYCVSYSSEYEFTWSGSVVTYTLTGITRAVEGQTTSTSISKMTCPNTQGSWVFLHVHPPLECEGDNDEAGPCRVGGMWAYQCFPSPTDMRTLNNSDKPFSLIQCDRNALVPYWRTAPLPVVLPFGFSR